MPPHQVFTPPSNHSYSFIIQETCQSFFWISFRILSYAKHFNLLEFFFIPLSDSSLRLETMNLSNNGEFSQIIKVSLNSYSDDFAAIFKASALWADAFYQLKCPCVCLSVRCTFSLRLPVFLPPLPKVQCPNFLDIRNP